MATTIKTLTAVIAFAVLVSPAMLSAQGQGRGQGNGSENSENYFKTHGYTKLNIPPGHYPSPGECRVWFPGRPPGQQPASGRCERLQYSVPPGAWLIRRPSNDHVHVQVYDDRRPNTVLVVGEFAFSTGVLLRVVNDK